MAILEEIVRTDNKQRYSFIEDKTLIRANQGHSTPVDVELQKTIPPAVLWHGTAEKYVSSILSQGLLPMSRPYVHLSGDLETAKRSAPDTANWSCFRSIPLQWCETDSTSSYLSTMYG